MSDIVARLNAALEGRYRIDRQLGEGGMATVFLAHDVKHDRQVAIKVLRPELAAVVGADRFLSEIRTTANLEDPHILPLYDSGEADSFLFYVMPYVEGDSLRDRLRREHQLPVEEAVDIARNVAGALAFAHQKGIVHRDIKPANILLRRGEPLVADFGIALALSEAGDGRLTETGLSLGTPHYMSPEQASGERSLDPRSDVYALGCVLYEMLTGEPPHAGPTAQAVLAKILTEEPRRARAVRRAVPENVDAALAKALEKLPADRMPSPRAFAEALDDPGFRHGDRTAGTGRPAEGRTGNTRPWQLTTFALAAVVAVLAGVIGFLRPQPVPEAPVFRAAISLPQSQGMVTPQLGTSFTLAPDGSRLVYASRSAGAPWQLWVRPADALDATPIPGTEASFSPAFSPDGEEVAYADPSGLLKVVDIDRGSNRTLADSAVLVVDWAPDGRIYYMHGVSLGDIWRVSAAGGDAEPAPVVSGAPGPTPLWGPGDVLPGGEAMVITRFPAGNAGPGGATLAVVDFTTGKVKDLGQGTDPRYLAGHLLWGTREGTLLRAPFDLERLEISGPAVPVAEGILLDATAVMHYGVSETGSLVYRTGASAGGVGGLMWVDREGNRERASDLEVGLTIGLWDSLDLSPDGTTVALSRADGLNSHIWIQRLDRDAPPSRVTFGGTFNVRPRWADGGRSLTFVSNLAGQGAPTQIWKKSAAGSGAPQPVVVADREVEEGFMSPDGKWYVYRVGGTTSNRDIYAKRVEGDSAGIPLVATSQNERSPVLSPDSRWLAYVSDEAGQDEVFVTPFPNAADGKWQVSAGGGHSAAWSPDGTELFFVGTSNDMMAASYTVSGGAFVVTGIRTLFNTNGMLMGINNKSYSINPMDGRFLVISLGDAEAQLVWVQNWDRDL